MDLNNEIMMKGPSVLEVEITNKISFYKYVAVISLMVGLACCIMYNQEHELSRAKSNQLQQREVVITEKSNQIKILEEFNINLSKNK